jgi:hypothetical protein
MTTKVEADGSEGGGVYAHLYVSTSSPVCISPNRSDQENVDHSMRPEDEASSRTDAQMDNATETGPFEGVAVLHEVLQFVRVHVFNKSEALQHSFAEHLLPLSTEDARSAAMQQTGGHAAASLEWAAVRSMSVESSSKYAKACLCQLCSLQINLNVLLAA